MIVQAESERRLVVRHLLEELLPAFVHPTELLVRNCLELGALERSVLGLLFLRCRLRYRPRHSLAAGRGQRAVAREHRPHRQVDVHVRPAGVVHQDVRAVIGWHAGHALRLTRDLMSCVFDDVAPGVRQSVVSDRLPVTVQTATAAQSAAHADQMESSLVHWVSSAALSHVGQYG